MIIFCESSDDFNSKDYKGYKPYTKPKRGYDWREYVVLNKDNDGVVSCHMCDIRRTGCIDDKAPRNKKKKGKRSIQTSLGDF